MAPTSIDGSDITGATIDGQDVSEITVDGQTVFEAGPDIPDGPAYLIDDWDDNKLQNRDGTITSTHNGVPSVYRPEWTILSGSPTATGGQFVSTIGGIGTDVNINNNETLTVEIENWTLNGSDDGTSVQFWYQDENNRWQADLSSSSGSLQVFKRVDGTFTSVSSVTLSDFTDVNVRIERDGTENWTVFVNGTQQDTFVDSFEPTANEIRLNPFGGNTGTTEIDRIKLS